MADFRTQSSRFRLLLRDKATNENVGIGNLQSVEIKLYNEFTKQVWLKFRYPQTDDWLPMTVEEGNTAVAFEITPDQSATAPTGVIVAQATYRVTDSRYASGYFRNEY